MIVADRHRLVNAGRNQNEDGSTMEPTIKCTTCGTDIPLTKTLAQPFIEAERARLEGEARERAEVIQKREAQLEEQRSLLAERERTLDDTVGKRIEAERETIAKAEAQKADQRVASQLKATEEALAEKEAKLEEARQIEASLRKDREALEAERRDFDLKLARQLDAERDKIREQALQDGKAQFKAELAEKDEAINTLRRETDQASRSASLEVERLNKKVAEAQQAEESLRQQTKELEEKQRDLELQVQRRLDEERQKIREQTQKDEQESHRLKLKEKDEQLESLNRKIEELRRRANQGSQQLQGEALEVDFETMLRDQFPDDEIEAVPVGRGGCDILHKVKGSTGNLCGTILWEAKNTKAWNQEWLSKLRDNQRDARADLAAILSFTLPDGLTSFDRRDGVWITGPNCALPLAGALRHQLIQAARERRAAQGQDGKKELAYNYLIGPEFKQNVAAIVEAHRDIATELEREKRYVQTLWKRREKQLGRMLSGTIGLVGDLGGIIGKGMPEIEGLTLPERAGNALPPPDSASGPADNAAHTTH